MKKKYLLWSYAVIALCIFTLLIAITVTSLAGMKGARNHMANPDNRKAIYGTAALVSRDTGLKIPDFRIQEQKPGKYKEGGMFRDTLIVYFYKGVPESAFESFEKRAKTIAEQNDTSKCVEIDGLRYRYEDMFVGGFNCYLSIQISKDSQFGEIIFGNYKPIKE